MNTTHIMNTPMVLHFPQVETWETPDLERLLKEVAIVLARRKTLALPSRESELLLKINQPALSPEDWQRYEILRAKLRAETINKVEQSELLALSQRQERANVERLGYLIELAQLRNISLDELMRNIGVESIASHARNF